MSFRSPQKVMFVCYDKNYGLSKMTKNHLLHSNGMGWLGGNSEVVVPTVKYIVKISHKGLLFGSYSAYQRELSNKVLDLRDRGKLMFKEIARLLILEGYRSPRGFTLGPESVFSIYKKRKIRDARMDDSVKIEIVRLEVSLA